MEDERRDSERARDSGEQEQEDTIDHHRDRHKPKEPNRDGGRSHDQVGGGGKDDNQQRKRRPVEPD